MSCTEGLRALSSLRQASQGLTLSPRRLPRRAPSCTQRRLQCSSPSLSLPATSNRPLARSRHHLQQYVRFISQVADQVKRRAYVALGSNMGDRVATIEKACKEMEASGKIKVLRTSSLWETKAMYVVDQDMFVNGACEVRSNSLQHIERMLTHAD